MRGGANVWLRGEPTWQNYKLGMQTPPKMGAQNIFATKYRRRTKLKLRGVKIVWGVS